LTEAKPQITTSRRVDHLIAHLSILDTKFSNLLNFNTLLATAVGILVSIRHHGGSGDLIFESNLQTWWFRGMIAVGFVTVATCLRGVLRLRWGDDPIQGEPPVKFETELTNKMIVSLVRRSASFRFAAVMTSANLLLLGCFVASFFWVLLAPICLVAYIAMVADGVYYYFHKFEICCHFYKKICRRLARQLK
jgi:hypothetical protein